MSSESKCRFCGVTKGAPNERPECPYPNAKNYQHSWLPADPSPTPWDFSTWGFYCDTCEGFFDLVRDGKVVTYDDNTCSYEHKACGQPARYIGYDHEK
jgi:hypothetical protein